ncbi:hypothetical protein HMPREF9120_00178 [Neisseria sp. oral taxon 020 str. F0370]|nr:hypothetical protein HMPREF9120_00178 [Neisseria sp. oral taxon 020 str. F0370]
MWRNIIESLLMDKQTQCRKCGRPSETAFQTADKIKSDFHIKPPALTIRILSQTPSRAHVSKRHGRMADNPFSHWQIYFNFCIDRNFKIPIKCRKTDPRHPPPPPPQQGNPP